MFSVREVITSRGTLQYRTEHLTGLRCRISPDRLKRQIDQSFSTFLQTTTVARFVAML